MQETLTAHDLKALLDWQAELGADEVLGETPIDRYAETRSVAEQAQESAKARVKQEAPAPSQVAAADPVLDAERAASEADTLEALQSAIAGFPHCELRKGARSLVFSDGLVGSRIMIIGEAPGRDEDLEGRPFVGRAGQLLDRMLAAIGLSRTAEDPSQAVYITNVLPWRPPQNRTPTSEEIAMLRPFLARHVALADPEVIVLMGNVACEGGLGRKGITRLRGTWDKAMGKPCLPMFHPAYLLRNPSAKRAAWSDLLTLQAHVERSD